MQITDVKLATIVQKYATHPEFLGIEIVDINQPGAVDDTLLHLAIVDGAVDDVNILLQCGADVNSIGDLGNTPLHLAALMCEVTCAEILLSHGANIEISNEFDEKAVDIARIMDCPNIVSLLGKCETHLPKLDAAMANDASVVDGNNHADALAKERWIEYRDMKKSSC